MAAAVSTNGTTWTAATLPSSAAWESVTYGNGTFVAVAGGSTTAAYSTNGTTWTAASLPSSAAWASVAYGNGTFVAVANSQHHRRRFHQRHHLDHGHPAQQRQLGFGRLRQRHLRGCGLEQHHRRLPGPAWPSPTRRPP